MHTGARIDYKTLRRNRHQLIVPGPGRAHRRPPRPSIDWYSARPFEVVQMDLKYIRDHKALTREQLIHLDRYNITNYQWGALDGDSRLGTISGRRRHGVTATIVFTVDHGAEFGGKSWLKVAELRKLIGGFGCKLVQNHKGHAEENSHRERSHHTDDNEFHIPRSLTITSAQRLMREATGYIYYYNNVREHSALDYQTPYQHLKAQLLDLNDNIRFIVPIMLDNVAVALGPWSGYYVLGQHLVLIH